MSKKRLSKNKALIANIKREENNKHYAGWEKFSELEANAPHCRVDFILPLRLDELDDKSTDDDDDWTKSITQDMEEDSTHV